MVSVIRLESNPSESQKSKETDLGVAQGSKPLRCVDLIQQQTEETEVKEVIELKKCKAII